MTFLRTNAGLTNQAVFLDVDYTVYIEGYSINREIKGPPPDEVFWSSVFQSFLSTKKVAFRPLGGKQALLDLAKKIKEGYILNCIACMDADYDRQMELIMHHPCIFYTHGYSWENDVVSINGLMEAVSILSAEMPNEGHLRPLLESACRRVARRGGMIGPVDIKAQKTGAPIQNKAKPGELLILTKNACPDFCPSKIKAKIRSIRNGRRIPFVGRGAYDFYREYHGKSVLLIAYHIAGYASSIYGQIGGISLVVFQNVLLKTFSRKLNGSVDPIAKHHQQQAHRIGVSAMQAVPREGSQNCR